MDADEGAIGAVLPEVAQMSASTLALVAWNHFLRQPALSDQLARAGKLARDYLFCTGTAPRS